MNSTENTQLTIGYWPIRGLVQHIFYLLQYTGTKYNFVKVTDRAEWIKGKPAMIEGGMNFPNLPYLQDGDVQISESQAIVFYIAQKYGDASLLYTPETRAHFFELWGVIEGVRGSFTGIAYASPSEEAFKKNVNSKLEFNKFKLQSLNTLLGQRKWITGDTLTVADFFLAEVTERLQAMSADIGINILEGYDNFGTHFEKFIAIPQIKAFRESDSFMATPWNNTQAAWK